MAYCRKVLVINGVERSIMCDADDFLSDVIRSLGLTGTKVGCGKGQCGACNVIVNGDLVRSCTKKISKVDDYSEILTIEGLGTADCLHPIQAAWIRYGGVQCGFCSPGFILSTKALLDQNPNPTRDEVRDWYTKNKNACRCTGYKPLVDAAMAAAAVLRGDEPYESLVYQEPEDGQVFHTDAPKPTALGKVLGVTDYGADIAEKVPGMLQCAPVMSEYSHAKILNIDTSEAEKAPGVIRVLTHKDIKGTNHLMLPAGTLWSVAPGDDRPILCEDKVFRMGDVVAVVVANTRKAARAAAKLVKVDYEELPAYIDCLDAIKPDAVEIHPGIPNVYYKRPLKKGEDTRKVFADAPHIAEYNFRTETQFHLTIEPDCANAFVDDDGYLTIMYKTHFVYLHKNVIGPAVGWDRDKVRVIENPSGGAFGYSISAGMSALIGGICVAMDGAPVSLVLDYREHALYTGKRDAVVYNARVAYDDDGVILGAECDLVDEKGAFSEASINLPTAMKYFMMHYNVPSAAMVGQLTFNNVPHATAYRCPGAKQAATLNETLMDMIAKERGLDPIEVRLRNVWTEDHCDPLFTTRPVFLPMKRLLEYARPKYEELKKHAESISTDERKVAAGLAIGGFKISNFNDQGAVDLELNPDNTVTIYNTWEDMGQGADIGTLAETHEILKPLGLSKDQIKLVMNDTLKCPNTGQAGGSRSNLVNNLAIQLAADKLLEAMKKDDGTYRTYDEMVAEGIDTKYNGHLVVPPDPEANEDVLCGGDSPWYTYAVFVAEVAVDMKTGQTEVLECHNITDVGITTNRLSLEGQGYSGLMHGIGYGLSEQFHDPKKHTNLIPCGFPYANMIPDGDHFTLTNLETPRDYSSLGVSGCSEGFESAAHAACINAIYEATGLRFAKLPVLPEDIKAGLEAKANGTYKLPEKWDMSHDFYEDFDNMIANPPKEFEGEVIVQH